MHDVTIQNIETGRLVEAQDNPNHMGAREYKALGDVIGEVGFLQPILVKPLADGFKIIDGHHRARAAKELGMETVPCVVVESGDDEEVVLRIAMNKLRGDLDLTGVGRALKGLSLEGWTAEDLSITGFSAGEVTDLLAAVSQDVEKGMGTTMEMPAGDYDADDTGDAEAKLFALTLQFDNREDLKKAKRALKRAGGKTKDMGLGLLKILGEDKEKTT